jgi:hypothetical protein
VLNGDKAASKIKQKNIFFTERPLTSLGKVNESECMTSPSGRFSRHCAKTAEETAQER